MKNKKIDILDLMGISDSDEKSLDIETLAIHLRMMNSVSELMNEKGDMNKTELASKLGTSKAHVSKLFSGDNYVNLKLLARLQRIFGIFFNVSHGTAEDLIKYTKQVRTRTLIPNSTKSSPFIYKNKDEIIESKSLVVNG